MEKPMAVVLSNVVKRYVGPDGSVVPVVDVPSFQLNDGEQVALVGTSGSGKTTLLHLIAGILTPDSGSIVYTLENRSVDITRLYEAERDVFRGRCVGYIFQTHHLLSGFTALENVLLGMSFGGASHEPGRAEHLLREVGLADRLHYKPAKLSVGQQQRVAVARALANRPKVVLADEPTGSLDPDNAQQVLELIRRLCKEVSAALLLVSHDVNIAGQLGRQVALKELGREDRIQKTGDRMGNATPSSLGRAPASQSG
jgi:putative ABC transport system ATP-binding protein